MKTGYSVEKLIEEFQNSVFPVFEKAIEHIPEAQRKDIKDKLREATNDADGVFPINSVHKLVSLKDTKLENLDEVWIDAIEEATANLPELVILVQDESHFVSRDGDSVFISVGKFFKRIRRFSRTGFHSMGNAFRRMFKKPETEFKVATREVPFKNIIQILLLRLRPEIIHWKQAQYRYISRVFEAIQSWTYPKATETENEHEEQVDSESETFQELVTKLIVSYDQEFEEEQKILFQRYRSIVEELKTVLSLIGTIELSTSKFDTEILDNEKSGFKKDLSSNTSLWLDLKDALILRLELLVSLKELEFGLISEESDFKNDVEQFYIRNIISGHKELSHIIREGMNELNESGSPAIRELISQCENIYEKVEEVVKRTVVAPLNLVIEQKKLSSFLNNYVENVTEFSSSQPEQGAIIEDLDIEGGKPVFNVKQVEWRRFVLRMINKHIATELDAAQIEPEESLSIFIERYQEVVQIIETNLDVIDEVSKKEQEEPVTIALKSLERSVNKINEVEELVKKERASLIEKLSAQNQLLIENLSALLIKQDVSEIKWADTQLKVKESAGDFNTKITVYWAKFLDRADFSRRFVSRKYRQYEDVVRGFLGLKKPVSQIVENTNLATFLHETDQKFEKLPFIYRRLFDFRREIEAGFFIHNPLYFDSCRKALELWKGGFPASINLIGEKGSGKSTLTRFLLDDIFKEEKSYNLSFSKTYWDQSSILKEVSNTLNLKDIHSPEDLVLEVKKKRKGSVVVLENLQNCYLRNMNGYDAIKSLLYIISETKKEILWVVTCSRYAWDFLNVAFNVGDYFSHSITTDILNADQMKQLILKRQKASGYQLDYIPDASTQKSRAYKKHLDDKEAEQQFLENKYFDKLTNLAEGNATVGMILWIRSIKEINEAYFTIESLEFMNTTSLDGLDAVSQFALSAFVLHDSLTAKELSTLLNQTESEAEMTVSRLASRGLLVATKDNYYALNDLVYRQVVRLLKNRNILH